MSAPAPLPDREAIVAAELARLREERRAELEVARRHLDDARCALAGEASSLVRGLWVRGLADAVGRLERAVAVEEAARAAVDVANARYSASFADPLAGPAPAAATPPPEADPPPPG